MTDSRIQPYSNYAISVTPLNGYGWGLSTNVSVTTSQYISSSVTNLTVTSSFPTSPLQIKWGVPQTKNGEIVQYFIFVQNTNTNQCLTMSINCTGCVNNITNFTWPINVSRNCTLITSTSFNTNNETFSIVMTDPGILTYTNYIISVTPLNGYGWGLSNNISITTAQYNSSSITNLTVTSSFPTKPLQINWGIPQTKNGEIVQYFIFVQNTNTNQCLTMSINCTGCVNNINNSIWPFNVTSNCGVVTSTSFYTTNQTFSIVMTDSSILTYTRFVISVTPLNGYGWGSPSSILIKSAQYISSSISNLTVTSSFPPSPLNITWMSPQVPNGEIVQYVILVQSSTNNQCLLSMSINCSNCINNITSPPWPDSSNTGCNVLNSKYFNTSSTTFTIVMTDSRIQAYTKYLISVTPLNEYGWGNMTTSTILTGENMSGPVNNLTVSSSFPSSPLQVTWAIPQIPNGEIVQYVILVTTSLNNQCLLSMSINCSNCVHTITSPAWPDNSTASCSVINGTTFSTNSTTISITITDSRIQAYSNYTISVTPLNGYGWGLSTNISVTTAQYISLAVTNLVAASAFPTDNLQLSWNSPSTPNGEITAYILFVNTSSACILMSSLNCTNCKSNMQGTAGQQNILCNNISGPSFTTTNQTFVVNITNTNIQPSTNYNYSVIPINGYGWGLSTMNSILTVNYSPKLLTNLTAQLNQSNITILWVPPDQHPFNFTYQIQITNTSYTRNDTAYNGINSYLITGLEYCSKYQICIKTITPYGAGNFTCITRTTDIAVANITGASYNVTGNTISLSWTYNNNSNCNVMFNVTTNGTTISTSNNLYSLTLLYFTNYKISIIPLTYVYPNVTTVGSPFYLNITTGSGYSEPVTSFTCTNSSFNSILCSWAIPSRPNGYIINYSVNCTNQLTNNPVYSANVTGLLTNITGLQPDILYACQICAYTIIGCGNISMYKLTIVASPKPYSIPNCNIEAIMSDQLQPLDDKTQVAMTLPYSCFNNNWGNIQTFSIVISQKKDWIIMSANFIYGTLYDKNYNQCNIGAICAYEIKLPNPPLVPRSKRDTFQPIYQNNQFTIGLNNNCSNPSDPACNGPLALNTLYYIGIRVYTSTGFFTFSVISRQTKNTITAIILGIIIPVGLLLIIIPTVLFYLKYKRKHRPPDESYIIPCTDFSPPNTETNSPMVNEFHNYFENMKKDSNGKMIDEFQEIKDQVKELEKQKILIFTDGNDSKNRYSNIKPYNHNRIKLTGSLDYINASRICVKHSNMDPENQCECKSIYIATQGPIGENKEPKVSTIGDFWKMVFEYDACVIVNLTRCDENGREKCAKYWPENTHETETYLSNNEPVEVTLLNSIVNTVFEERNISISMKNQNKTITQLHMLAFPDHGCPKISEFLQFYAHYQKIRIKNQAVVVHCSAGVGRTGTFILIDEELSRIAKESDKIEIFNNLLKLRKCRCQMVQTESQYCFIYTIVHDYLVQKGFIKIPRGNLLVSANVSEQSYSNPIFNETD